MTMAGAGAGGMPIWVAKASKLPAKMPQARGWGQWGNQEKPGEAYVNDMVIMVNNYD